MKDYVMETVTTVQENASDILASAKDLNEERAAKKRKKRQPHNLKLLRKSNRKEPLIRLFFMKEKRQMKAIILHESKGRIRFRIGQKK